MQALISFAASKGFALTDIHPDSEVHRFKRQPGDKDKDAWYVCHQAHSRAGEIFYVLIVKDWREDELHKFNTLKGGVSDDYAYIEEQIKKAQEKARKDQERLWEETAERAGKEWDSHSEADERQPYLVRKAVKPYGLKGNEHGELLVPLRDTLGKLWGWQRITATEKRFLYGCKVQGNFHTLGTLDTQAILCEGYATGASIHEATGLCVIIGFNAGNLPKVATALLQAHPALKLIVAADNDQWTTGNPGITQARKCAALKVISPRFKSLETHPTDFNDLHVLEGLATVKEQILNDNSPKQYIMALGHKEDDYYYTSSSNRQIVKISRSQHNQSNLLDLMPLTYWQGRFPGAKGTDWTAAQDFLQQAARIKGIYDEENIRGLGVWRDADRYLINLGDSLYLGNTRLDIADIDTKFVYEIGKRLPEPSQSELDLKLLPELMEKISFKNPESKIYFLGFLTVAPIAGALHWRPHVWLNGASNTGKSTIMQVVSQVFGPYKHYFQGQSTEPGIRQTTRNNSLPIIFDEFETDDGKSSERVQLILELARQASSETDGHVAKGSPQGKAVTARPKFSAIFSSIRKPNLGEADHTRITDIEIVKLKDPERFDAFKELAARITPEFSNAYISRIYRLLPQLQECIDLFWDIMRRHHSARIGQQYGTLLAGWWMAQFDAVPDREYAEKLCQNLKIEQASEGTPEEMECIDHMMNSLIPMAGGAKQNLRELVSAGDQKNMQRYGVLEKESKLWVSTAHPELKKIFRDTKWAGGWGKSLGRLEGAEARTQYFIVDDKGKTTHAVGIPMRFILENNVVE